MAENNLPQRHRRTNPKRKRDEIFCYEEEFEHNEDSGADSEEEREAPSEEDEDDSFTYGVARLKKTDAKRRKIKSKLAAARGKPDRDKPKKERADPPELDYVDYVYSSTGKAKAELKIFNPELHVENYELKVRYERELEEVYTQFGRRFPRVEEPPAATRWKYLLRQVEEAGKDFASEREERLKLKRKIAKFAQSTCNRLEQIKEQRVRE